VLFRSDSKFFLTSILCATSFYRLPVAIEPRTASRITMQLDTCELNYLCVSAAGDSPSFLMLISGICWTAAYVLYISSCQRHQSYVGIPPAALFLNLSWEFFFSFFEIQNMSPAQVIVNRTWFFLDVIIFLQFLRFHVRTGSVTENLWLVLLALTMAIFLVSFIHDLHDYSGIYIAFLQNLLMSVLFAKDVLDNKNEHAPDSRSTWIPGLCRLTGTAAASIYFFIEVAQPTVLLNAVYLMIFAWDSVYFIKSFKDWMEARVSYANVSTSQ